MFLNVTDHSSEENSNCSVFQTSLSSQSFAEKLVTSFPVDIPVPKSAQNTRLWNMIYLREDNWSIVLKSIFPFWWEIYRNKRGIYFARDPWRKWLLWQWLARKIEYMTLSILAQKWWQNVWVYTDWLTSSLRERQLRKIWFEDGITLGHYLQLLVAK